LGNRKGQTYWANQIHNKYMEANAKEKAKGGNCKETEGNQNSQEDMTRGLHRQIKSEHA
jgi:hypothetical protein